MGSSGFSYLGGASFPFLNHHSILNKKGAFAPQITASLNQPSINPRQGIDLIVFLHQHRQQILHIPRRAGG